jgi:AcrR family transcriptional regulator
MGGRILAVMAKASGERAAGAPRMKRSTEQIRALLLNSARNRFAVLGYARTTTREIAEHAGVSEYLLFKHFGSKAALFEVAVADPFRRAIDDFLGRWGPGSGRPHAAEATAYEFVDGLYGLVEGQRELLMALLGADASDPDGAPMDGQPLVPLLDELERLGTYELGAPGHAGVNQRVVVRCMFGMVAFVGAFQNSLYPRGVPRPHREQVVHEMTMLLVHGVTHRPPSGLESGFPDTQRP